MMQFLLDTNVLLWYFMGSSRIEPVKNLITSKESDVYISIASFWEITIKIKTGKLKIDLNELRSFAKNHAFFELPISGDYFNAYMELPQIHKDPFDHILLAQAKTSPMRLITGNSTLAEYSSLVIVI
jgi:PIN domain nuclease of toxin-antitoxin system